MRPPPLGDPLHTRWLGVALSRGAEGRVRAEGRVLDLRKRGFVPLGGDLQSAGIIHDMRVSAEVDAAGRVLERVRAAQPTVAFEAAPETGGESCRDPIDRIRALEGRPLDDAFAGLLSRALGGPRGCSHVLTLARLLATAARRGLDLEEAAPGFAAARRPGERFFQRSLFVDGFEAEGGALQLAVRLGDVHAAPTRSAKEPLDRLARHDEVRVDASVALESMALTGIRAGGRRRLRAALADANWRDRSRDVAPLDGRAVLSGLAAEVLRRFGPASGDELLCDALLNLAPGFIQCFAALVEPGTGTRRPAAAPTASVIGGAPDSCFMWRRGGGLLQIRTAAGSGRGSDD